jgi:stage II sporulation protein E
VDICRLDLYEGALVFYKVGAAATFIKRGGEAAWISGESLPVGAQTFPQISTDSTHISHGDYVVLMTDGVLEQLRVPSPEQTMCEVLETINAANPSEMAKKILDRVLLFTGGRVRDDMTVLVAGIWEKE